MIDWFRRKPYLAIVVAGDKSTHKSWAPHKMLDVIVVPAEEGVGKWTLVKRALEKVKKKYRAYWMPDDNILISSDDISQLFGTFEKQRMHLAHPAKMTDEKSFFSVKLDFSVRFTNFVCPSSPVFSKTALDKLSHTFDGCGSGLGWVWPRLLNFDGTGIIDDAGVHGATMPIGYDKGKESRLLLEYGIYSPFYVQFTGVRKKPSGNCRVPLADIMQTDKYKMRRPMRRQNGCCGACASLSTRLMNYTARM